MKAPKQIRDALECLAQQERDKVMCSCCAYRRDPNCMHTAAKDALSYIKRLEKTALSVEGQKGGRRRTVYLYTVTDEQGEVLCADLPRAEAAAALGYASENGIQYAWLRQQKGIALPIRITRRKGMVGTKGPLIERPPVWLYAVEKEDGTVVADGVNLRDLARHFGLTAAGMNSAINAGGMRAMGIMEYRGHIVRRTKAKERLE